MNFCFYYWDKFLKKKFFMSFQVFLKKLTLGDKKISP